MATRQQPEEKTDAPPQRTVRWELFLYALAVVIGVAGMLLVPRLLNNMVFVMAVLLLVVWVVPAWLRSRR